MTSRGWPPLPCQFIAKMLGALRALVRHAAGDGRVEMWRGGLGLAYLFPALSSAGASRARPCSVSTLPLIKPDVRISRIRLSDKGSRVRSRKVTLDPTQSDQTEVKIQVLR